MKALLHLSLENLRLKIKPLKKAIFIKKSKKNLK